MELNVTKNPRSDVSFLLSELDMNALFSFVRMMELMETKLIYIFILNQRIHMFIGVLTPYKSFNRQCETKSKTKFQYKIVV